MEKVLVIWEEVPEKVKFYVKEFGFIHPEVEENFKKLQGIYIGLENSKEEDELLNLFSEELADPEAEWKELDKSEITRLRPDILIICGIIL